MSQIQLAFSQSFPVSPETASRCDQLAARLETLNAILADLERQKQELSGVAVGEWSHNHRIKSEQYRGRLLAAKNDELSLRESFDGLCDTVAKADYPAARQVASEEFERAKSDLTAALIGIGFEAHCIVFDTLSRHPRVKAARMTVDSLPGRCPCLDAQQANAKEIEKLKTAIESIRSKDLALAG